MKRCVVCEKPIAGKQQDHYYRVKAQTNTYHSQTVRSLKRKLELIERLGGGCRKCGYRTNIAALHFHHSDPNTKRMKLDMRVLSNRNWEVIVAEASKCELLCSNCHAEAHHPELVLSTIQQLLSGASRQETTG
ncbi:hypothetical protein LRS06_17190 [Hymenobacter sp. J193]|uniref:hypothetical protein n=1 Tax=Hymenobacter sp. J193 TaxID=2898429 RepID=UPI002150AAB3|nr:hypothetical protein [Hymenobacter sp. J193]MCR5889473.1 hypothetical protein [Hymenobacter sp. J193]